MTTTFEEPNETHLAAAQSIIDQGYYQVSRAFRTVRRLPFGMTGKEALRAVTPPERHYWVDAMRESGAGDYFLRTHDGAADECVLDIPTFAAFRKLGGGTYMAKMWEADEEQVTKFFLCNPDKIVLKPNRTYRVELHPNCAMCRAILQLQEGEPNHGIDQ